ncbi:MAG: carboxypeptidase regulatory-like domain-containing protein [Candidatus Methanomethylophilaceae archaeon]
MRYGPLATILVLALISCPIVLLDSVAAEGDVPVEPVEPTDITIRGFVGDVSTEGNVPLNGVLVQLLDSERRIIGTCVTGEKDLDDGEFRFTYPDGKGTYLSFSIEGYTARTWPITMTMVENNLLSFSIDGLTPDKEGCYDLTSSMTEGSFVAMRMTSAHIMGYVRDDKGNPLNGANVTVRSSDDRIVTGTTDSSGYFEISCYYGTYTVQVSCNGFESSQPSTVSTTDPALTIVMKEKVHTMLWGLDTAHTMELIGILMVALSFIIVSLIYRRSKSEDSEIVFINDLDDDDDKVNNP